MTEKRRPHPLSTLAQHSTRREFVSKARYAAPVLLSLPAIPGFAQLGSAGSGGGGDTGPVDCVALYEQFLSAGGYPSLQEIIDALNSPEVGGDASLLSPELYQAFTDLNAAFPEGVLCGNS